MIDNAPIACLQAKNCCLSPNSFLLCLNSILKGGMVLSFLRLGRHQTTQQAAIKGVDSVISKCKCHVMIILQRLELQLNGANSSDKSKPDSCQKKVTSH